jgi:hypothetical protein
MEYAVNEDTKAGHADTCKLAALIKECEEKMHDGLIDYESGPSKAKEDWRELRRQITTLAAQRDAWKRLANFWHTAFSGSCSITDAQHDEALEEMDQLEQAECTR